MTVIAMKSDSERFKKAIVFSITVHVSLFILLLVSPYIHIPKSKKMIHYVSVFSVPGGGGGASEKVSLKTRTQEEVTETAVQKRESLADLTTLQKMEEQNTSSLRFPVEKPKREKKTVIEKQTKPTPKKPEPTLGASTQGSDSGSGIKIGVGGGDGSGEGTGSGFESEIGLSSFPFPYYPPLITKKVSNFWEKFYSGAEELFTTVFFKIYRNGRIGDLKVVGYSGNFNLDRSATRAILLAAPFAPLPQAYAYEYLEIQLTFEHAK